MKKRIISILILASLSLIFISSCKKFEDGPAFSLRTKKARITGNWKIDFVSFNGKDETEAFKTAAGPSYELIIEKDGKYKSTGNFEDTGKWKFGEDKDDIYMTSDDPGSIEMSYRITRLKNKELGLRHIETNGTVSIYKYKQ